MNISVKPMLLATAMLSFLTQALFAQIPKSMRRLPDTGQTLSFTNTPGEDSDFEQNPPFFMINNDGTATDTVTGLMWQQSDGGEMTIENAETYCQNLSLGGFNDWRLPTAQEAFSILNHSKQNPAFDPVVFPNTGAEYWWTSERQVGNPGKIWVTNAGGGIGNHPKTETLSAGGTKKFHARAVRDVAAVPAISQQFAVSDSSLLDRLTGLEWQRYALPDSVTWENALLLAENFLLDGKSDWRLPNVKELQSINDETRSQPSVSTDAFPGIRTGNYWSSTSLPSQPVQAWYLDTRFGIVSHVNKTARNYVLLVRGGDSGTTFSPELAGTSREAVRVFPNPFSSKITVEFLTPEARDTDSAFGYYQLFDRFGRLILSGSPCVHFPATGGRDSLEIDFSELPNGLYLLKTSGKNTVAARIVKI